MAELLNEETFAGYVADSALPVLVDFFRDGCIPCRRIAPLFSRAESAYAGKVNFARVNLTVNPNLAAQYQIEAAPTLLVFANGAEVGRRRGAVTAGELTELLDSI